MPATQTAMTSSAIKTVTVGSADASSKLSNRAFHAAGTAAYWWLRDVYSLDFKLSAHRVRAAAGADDV